MGTLLLDLTAGTTALSLLGALWRGLRGLHQFVAAVTTNTAAVAQLAGELREHTLTTTATLSALDQRVTTLEGNPHG